MEELCVYTPAFDGLHYVMEMLQIITFLEFVS